MSEQVELTNPVDLSVGGMSGHIFRRIFHISMFIIPYIYFEFGNEVAERIGKHKSINKVYVNGIGYKVNKHIASACNNNTFKDLDVDIYKKYIKEKFSNIQEKFIFIRV